MTNAAIRLTNDLFSDKNSLNGEPYNCIHGEIAAGSHRLRSRGEGSILRGMVNPGNRGRSD